MARQTVLLLGATGTIGRATLIQLRTEGYEVVAPVRPGSNTGGLPTDCLSTETAAGLLTARRFDAVISCLASRTGLDAWDVDYALNSAALKAAVENSVPHFVLLSAICVQKPMLPFQHAKLAFEAELQAAPITHSIVRTTAYFKSLSGQLSRVKQGKPYLLFGDGTLTACKPIGDRDTARYLTRCLTDETLQNRILPIGGPGPAVTPKEQGVQLFDALGLEPRFAHVPIALMTAIVAGMTPFARFSQRLREKLELARVGRYYATESMLVWDPVAGRYDAEKTPEFGSDTLADHFRALASGEVHDDRGAHTVF